ncbi:MerC domain-containing protein [Fulvivirga aurantia]|uniref:MerC domain-containing protein n=1 Tax=Fulvivirga aurantia TaxID=2529383 RepID=UPI0016293E9A|nr:MerC domain-containing protein [Fulvivirga aurantia]
MLDLKNNRTSRFVGLHLDLIGFSSSVLCAIHCAALPFLLSLAPLANLQFLNNPWVEYAIIIASFLIACFALIHGYSRHHHKPQALVLVVMGFVLISTGHLAEWNEAVFTTFGATIVAIAHLINWRQIKQSKVDYPDCLNHSKSK